MQNLINQISTLLQKHAIPSTGQHLYSQSHQSSVLNDDESEIHSLIYKSTSNGDEDEKRYELDDLFLSELQSIKPESLFSEYPINIINSFISEITTNSGDYYRLQSTDHCFIITIIHSEQS